MNPFGAKHTVLTGGEELEEDELTPVAKAPAPHPGDPFGGSPAQGSPAPHPGDPFGGSPAQGTPAQGAPHPGDPFGGSQDAPTVRSNPRDPVAVKASQPAKSGYTWARDRTGIIPAMKSAVKGMWPQTKAALTGAEGIALKEGMEATPVQDARPWGGGVVGGMVKNATYLAALHPEITRQDVRDTNRKMTGELQNKIVEVAPWMGKPVSELTGLRDTKVGQAIEELSKFLIETSIVANDKRQERVAKLAALDPEIHGGRFMTYSKEEGMKWDNPSVSKFLHDMVENAPNLVGAGLAMLAKKPKLAELILMEGVLKEIVPSYHENIKAGDDHYTAFQKTKQAAVGVYLLERTGLMAVMGKSPVGAPIRKYLKDHVVLGLAAATAVGVVGEGSTELMQEYWQYSVDKGYPGTLGDFMEEVDAVRVFAAGAGLGGGAAAFRKSAEMAIEHVQGLLDSTPEDAIAEQLEAEQGDPRSIPVGDLELASRIKDFKSPEGEQPQDSPDIPEALKDGVEAFAAERLQELDRLLPDAVGDTEDAYAEEAAFLRENGENLGAIYDIYYQPESTPDIPVEGTSTVPSAETSVETAPAGDSIPTQAPIVPKQPTPVEQSVARDRTGHLRKTKKATEAAGQPFAGKAVHADTFEDLPPSAQAAIRADDVKMAADAQKKGETYTRSEDVGEAFYDKSTGIAYVIGDRLMPSEIPAKILHEVAVHGGLHILFAPKSNASQDVAASQKQFRDVLDHVYGNKEAQAMLDRVAAGYGYDVSRDQTGRPTNPEQFYDAMEEVLAHIGETRKSAPKIWDRFVAAMTRFLRKAGLAKHMSNAEVRILLEEAYDAAKDPARAAGRGDVVASRVLASKKLATPGPMKIEGNVVTMTQAPTVEERARLTVAVEKHGDQIRVEMDSGIKPDPRYSTEYYRSTFKAKHRGDGTEDRVLRQVEKFWKRAGKPGDSYKVRTPARYKAEGISSEAWRGKYAEPGQELNDVMAARPLPLPVTASLDDVEAALEDIRSKAGFRPQVVINKGLDSSDKFPPVATDDLEGGKVRTLAKSFHALVKESDRIIFHQYLETGKAFAKKKKAIMAQVKKGKLTDEDIKAGHITSKQAKAKIERLKSSFEKKHAQVVDRAAARIKDALHAAGNEYPKFQSWYESRLEMAFDIFGEIDSRAKRAEDRFILRTALAITSNGNSVKDQTFDSWNVYQDWLKKGKMGKTKVNGTRKGEIRNGLRLMDKLIKDHTWQVMEEFLSRVGTVREVQDALVRDLGLTRAEAKRLTNGELMDEVVPYSLIFGAKLGSFYNNLSGNFDTTTMDRWFMRTFGRTMGHQMDPVSREVIQEKRTRALDALDAYLSAHPDKELLKEAGFRGGRLSRSLRTGDLKQLNKYFMLAENREAYYAAPQAGLGWTGSLTTFPEKAFRGDKLIRLGKGGSAKKPDYISYGDLQHGERVLILSETENNLRMALNGLYKQADGFNILEAPMGGNHRRFIRHVMAKAIAGYKADGGLDLNPAESQAILWYYEKLVHDTFGSKQTDDDPDYGAAANKLYKSLNDDRDAGSYRTSDAIRRRGRVSVGSGDDLGATRGGAPDAPGGVKPSRPLKGATFVSPNETELDFPQAQKALSGPGQKALRDFSTNVDKALGHRSTDIDAIGDWSDGAENTVVTEYQDALTYEDIEVAAAIKGAFANQKAVIPFAIEENGEQVVYDMELPADSDGARAMLDKAGLPFRTLIDAGAGKTRTMIFDPDGSLEGQVKQFGDDNGIEVEYIQGRGAFLGSWESRDEGRGAYETAIRSWVQKQDQGSSQDRVNSIRGLASEAFKNVDPTNDIRFSRPLVTPEQDKAYVRAVANKDVKAQQKLVDAAAKQAGYTQKMFHGGDPSASITVFKPSSAGAIWFTDNPAYAEFVSLDKFEKGEAKVVNAFLSLRNPLDLRGVAGNQWDSLRDDPTVITDAKAQGYDGVILQDTNGGITGTSYIVFNPNQIKSADPITRDGKGNVTPLSERFNDQSNDIRFSRPLQLDPNRKWSGVVSLLDGEVEKTFTYKQAEGSDFHHSFLVSPSDQERITAGEAAYFFLNGDGEPLTMEGPLPVGIRGGVKKHMGSGQSPDIRFSRPLVTPEQDAEYLQAIDARNKPLIQKLVDAARGVTVQDASPYALSQLETNPFQTGKPFVSKSYHGTTAPLVGNKFNPQHLGDSTKSRSATLAHFTAGEKSTAETYTWPMFSDETSAKDYNWENRDPQLYNLTVAMTNPLVVDYKGRGSWDHDYGVNFYKDLVSAKEKGHDGVVWLNTKDGGSHPDTIFGVLSGRESSIKSADPITRDGKGKVIPLSERFNDQTNDIRFSRPLVTPEQDAAYMKAVDARNKPLIQKLVDAAAKAAGYTQKMFRGMSAPPENNQFRPSQTDGLIWLAQNRGPNPESAETWISDATRYGSNITEVYVNPGTQGDFYIDDLHAIEPASARADWMREKGFDSAVDQQFGGTMVVLDPSRLKSADPITRDGKGNVIPLSERFNDQSNDIRFSRPLQETDQHRFSGRTSQDQRLTPEIRKSLVDRMYRVVHNKDVVDKVMSDLDASLAKVSQDFFDEKSGITGEYRVTAGMALAMAHNNLGKQATELGQGENATLTPQDAHRAAVFHHDEATRIMEHLDEVGLKAGRTIQAFSMWGDIFDSPMAAQRYWMKTVKRIQEQELRRHEPVIKKVTLTVNTVNETIASEALLESTVQRLLAKARSAAASMLRKAVKASMGTAKGRSRIDAWRNSRPPASPGDIKFARGPNTLESKLQAATHYGTQLLFDQGLPKRDVWDAEMVSLLGPNVEAHLDDLYHRSMTLASEILKGNGPQAQTPAPADTGRQDTPAPAPKGPPDPAAVQAKISDYLRERLREAGQQRSDIPAPATQELEDLSQSEAEQAIQDLFNKVPDPPATEVNIDAEVEATLDALIQAELKKSAGAQVDTEIEQQKKHLRALIRQKAKYLVRGQMFVAGRDVDHESTINEGIRRSQYDLAGLLVKHYSVEDQASTKLVDKLADEAGLSRSDAVDLALALGTAYQSIANRKRASMIKQMLRKELQGLTPPGRKMDDIITQVIKLSNLGALNDAATRAAFAQRMKLPTSEPAIMAELARRADEIQLMPEDSIQRRDASIEMMRYMESQKTIRAGEVVKAIWYGNVLSGFKTHERNIISTLMNGLADVAIIAGQGGENGLPVPRIVAETWRGYIAGGKSGWQEYMHLVKTGNAPLRRDFKVEAPGTFETNPINLFRGRFLETQNWWKYVSRLLMSEDMLFFKAAQEARSYNLAARVAHQEGNMGAQYKDRVEQLLANSGHDVATYKAQAIQEGLTGMQVKRRVQELMEQGRDAEIWAPAGGLAPDDFAARATFNFQPEGFVGLLAQGMGRTFTQLPFGYLAVAFTRIVANVFTASNMWSPMGFIHLHMGMATGRVDGKMEYRQLEGDERAMRKAKAIIGTTLLGTMLFEALNDTDDDDDWFGITGPGPVNRDHANQLRSQGWQPYSIRLGGKYWNYLYSPLFIPLSTVGLIADNKKYGDWDEADMLSRVALALISSAQVLVDMTFLSGLADLSDTITRRGDSENAAKTAGKLFGKSISGFVTPNLVKQAYELFDPTLHDSHTVMGAVTRNIPILNSLTHKPRLNQLGEPIELNTGVLGTWLVTTKTEDDVWSMLAQKQAFITKMSSSITIDKEAVTDEEIMYDYQRESGLLLKSYLTRYMESLKQLDPADFQDRLNKETRNARDKAKVYAKRRLKGEQWDFDGATLKWTKKGS